MDNDNLHIAVSNQAEHIGHRCRSLSIDKSTGIKTIYCQDCSKLIDYVFKKAKGWQPDQAEKFSKTHFTQFKSFKHFVVDQETEFVKVVGTMLDDVEADFLPYSPSYVMKAEIVEEKVELTKEAKEAAEKAGRVALDNIEEVSIVKVDSERHLVYGVFLYPEKADHDGDVISALDIEKVAHGFMIDYRDIDEMHKKETMDAEIVESFIAWKDDLDFFGKILAKGTWAGTIHVNDDEVWEKVKDGTYKGFSVRISGFREPINV